MTEKGAILLPVLPYGRVDNVLYSAKIGFAPEVLSLERALAEVRNAAHEKAELVFPSHFFEYENRLPVLQEAERLGLSVRIQISAGTELIDFYSEALNLAVHPFSLDVILDRPPHPWDLEKLEILRQKKKIALRFVFCPTRDFDPHPALNEIRRIVSGEVFVYFAPKRSPKDRFLTQDEIFLLEIDLPVIRYRNETLFAADDFRARFTEAGRFAAFRRTIVYCAQNALLRPGLVLLYYTAWILRKPLDALRELLSKACIVIRNVFQNLFYLLRRLFYILRSLFYLLQRLFHAAHRAYLVLRYPFAKVYWFSEYQFRKRIVPLLPWVER